MKAVGPRIEDPARRAAVPTPASMTCLSAAAQAPVKKIVSMESFKLLRRTEGSQNQSSTKNVANSKEGSMSSASGDDPEEKIRAYQKVRAELFPDGKEDLEEEAEEKKEELPQVADGTKPVQEEYDIDYDRDFPVQLHQFVTADQQMCYPDQYYASPPPPPPYYASSSQPYNMPPPPPGMYGGVSQGPQPQPEGYYYPGGEPMGPPQYFPREAPRSQPYMYGPPQ